MRTIRFEYGIEEIFEYIRSVTLLKNYNPNIEEENNRLSEVYGLTVDDQEFFMRHCLKPACDSLFCELRNHTFGTEPYAFNVLSDPLDPTSTYIIYFDMNVGAAQDNNIKNHILYTLRDYSLTEWYKMKGEIKLAAFHNNEYNESLSKLQWFTKGNNTDENNINYAKRRGIFN